MSVAATFSDTAGRRARRARSRSSVQHAVALDPRAASGYPRFGSTRLGDVTEPSDPGCQTPSRSITTSVGTFAVTQSVVVDADGDLVGNGLPPCEVERLVGVGAPHG